MRAALAARTFQLLVRQSMRQGWHAQHLQRHHSTSSSVSADELSHFSGLASSWWDPMGPSRVLHLMNPLRHDFIGQCLAESESESGPESESSPADPTLTTTPSTQSQSSGLRYLDIGCGGGIFAESLARTIPPNSPTTTSTHANSILAIDPSSTLIQIARDHARQDPTVYDHLRNGKFEYRNTTLEDLSSSIFISPSPSPSPQHQNHISKKNSSLATSSENQKSGANNINTSTSSNATSVDSSLFDVVTLFEVIEHVDPSTSSPLEFLTHCFRLLRPGGWLVGSTIARTLPSFLVNKMVAEAPWPIGVVPWGTHEWNKFVNAPELQEWAKQALVRSVLSLNELPPVTGPTSTEALPDMRWKVAGVVYFPGIGWKMVNGGENWGNYFWAVRKGTGVRGRDR